MSKCKHWDDQTLTYEKEDKLHSRGLRQTQCSVCNRWFWPHEWAKKPTPKKRRMVRVKAIGCVILHDGKWEMITDKGNFLIPPETPILIDEKYLRRKP